LSQFCLAVTHRPGLFLLAGLGVAFLVGRALFPRLPGAGAVRASVAFLGNTVARLARGAIVGFLLSTRGYSAPRGP
jgi:hypothetical protein